MNNSNHPIDDNIHETASSTSTHAESKHATTTATDANTTTASVGPTAPLSVFFLPQDLIASLVPQAPSDTLGHLPPLPLEPTRDTDNTDTDGATAQRSATSLDSAVPSCRICGIANLESVEKQREHVRLDWHRYNLKQQLLDKSARPITEHQFENMIQDLSSISGSDTDDSDDDNQQRTTGTAAATVGSNNSTAVNSIRAGGDDQEILIQSLMKKLELTVKQNQNARNQDPVLVLQQQALERQLQEARSSPFIWFTSTLYDETVRLGIYKNALPNRGVCEDVVEYLKTVQFAVAPVVKKQKNNKLRREAKRAAAAAAAAAGGEAGAGQEQEPQQAIAKQDFTPSSAAAPASTPVTQPDAEDDDDDDEEEEQDQDWVKYQLQAKQQQQPAASIQPPKQARYWTLILIGGGHFAGVVMDLAGQASSHGRDMKVVAHKTFHRYTVRKKQGGSQAAHGVANSAGARIRMYNEEALKLEVRELLEGWSHWIKQSECVFVHSPGNNRKVLYYENSVLSAAEKQGRLRSIPFMTRRPTLTELKRAFVELTTVKLSVLTKGALERQAQAEQDALEKALAASASASASASPKDHQKAAVIPEAPAELLKLIELVKKGRAEAMSTHLLKHGIDPSQLLPLSTSTEYDIRRTPTILHLAAHHGQAHCVKLLLEKHNADPTTTTLSAAKAAAAAVDGDGEEEEKEEEAGALTGSSFTAYDIAKDKETRNAFRRAMALSPESWDWVGLAHVPSALTPEMEAEQERKAKEKTRKLLDAERERKKTSSRPGTPVNRSVATAPTSTPTSTSSSLLGKNLVTATSANSHLSPEMRMRLERERRANAAEARMTAMKQQETIRRAVQEGKNVCVACGKSLDGLTPFDKFGRKFCTTDCVAKGPA